MVPEPDPSPSDGTDDGRSAARTDGGAAGADGGDRGCPKCGHANTEVGTISTTGGGLSKMFDVQTNKFKVVSCTGCGYSELYRDATSGSGDIVDVFLG